MISIRTILADLYADRTADQLYSWLGQQGLLDGIKRAIAQLNAIIENEATLIKDYKSLPIGHIACNLLHAVNDRIVAEGDPEKAKELENILGDISIAILTIFVQQIKSEKTIAWLHINYALKDACEFYNYDYHQLITLLKIPTAVSLLQSHQSAEPAILPAPVPSLRWNGSSASFDDFLDIFTTQKLVASKKGLAKLFNNPPQALQLFFEPVHADLTVQFFYTIKNNRLVIHVGCKGFYQAVEYHILDFRKDFLKNKEPKSRINALRHSKSKWRENQLRIDRWLHAFAVPETVPRT